MPRRTFALSSLAVSTVALTAAALVASATVPAGAAVPTGRPALRVYSTGTHGAVVPASIRPGVVHVRDIGRDELLILRATSARSTRHRAAADLRSFGGGRLQSDFRVIGIAVPGEDSYVQMARGTFLFVDPETQHVTAGKIATMRVEGARVDAAVPASRSVLVTRHKQLHVPFHLPKKTWLHVGNRSSAVTSFLFIGVAKRTTYKMLHAAVEHPSLLKLFRLSSFNMVPLSIVGPHNAAWMHFHARPGRYVATVFAFSAHTGLPSLHHGQVRTLHVR